MVTWTKLSYGTTKHSPCAITCLAFLVSSKFKVLAPLESDLFLLVANCALHPQHHLLGGLSLRGEGGSQLKQPTQSPRQLALYTSPATQEGGMETRLPLLGWSAILAVQCKQRSSASVLGEVSHQAKFGWLSTPSCPH